MPPQPALNLLPTVQGAIDNLLTVYEPEFLRFGYQLFIAFATIVIAWQGIRDDVLAGGPGGPDVRLRQAPARSSRSATRSSPSTRRRCPGIGVSFSNLITDQAALLPERPRGAGLRQHLPPLRRAVRPLPAAGRVGDPREPDLLVGAAARSPLAKAVSLGVVAFGLIATAVCALLGPIFVPFFIVPKLDWLFWGWLKSFIQYSFIPVVAVAFLMIFEQFVFRYVTTLPPTITAAGVRDLRAAGVRRHRDVLRRHPARAHRSRVRSSRGAAVRACCRRSVNLGRLFTSDRRACR